MNRPLLIISAPVDTYSGYGARARDIVLALLKLDKYDVQILAQRWGNTRTGYLKDHKLAAIKSRIVPQIASKPQIWIQLTVPNEFQAVGEYNIGMTAGMETTLVAPQWIDGMNKMDVNFVSSIHSKDVFERTSFDMKNKKTNQLERQVKLEKPIEVLLEGADLTKYLPAKSSIDLSEVKESFAYLVCGHWMQGSMGHDRKNIAYTIKSFFETFKNSLGKTPALIVKTSRVSSSIMDREAILDQIDSIRKSVNGSKFPNVYLVHGEMSDTQVNELYNHPKVKAMISLTKGEGFGRPLLEFSLTKKPIIASGWSGQLDFLKPEYSYLLPGTIHPVDNSAVVPDMILPEAQWFQPDPGSVAKAYKEVFKQYKKFETKGKQQAQFSRANFSFDTMVTKLDELLVKYLPVFAEKTQLEMPKLKLPTLKKKTQELVLPKLK